MIIIIELSGELINTGNTNNPIETRKGHECIYVPEDNAMADKKDHRKDCVDACDKKFIECVENGRQDCLDRFGSCSSACKI